MSAISNNYYVIRQLIRYMPMYVFAGVFYAVITGLRTVYLNMYMVNYAITAVEKHSPFFRVIAFLIISAIILMTAYLLEAFWIHLIKPIYSEKINFRMQTELFDTSIQIPLKAFDDTQYYDDYVVAMNSGNMTTQVFDNHLALIVSLSTISGIVGLAFTMDLSIVLIAFISFIISMYTNIIIAECQAKLDLGIQHVNRKDQYIRRIFYIKKHQQDLKLYNLKQILFRQIEEVKMDKKALIEAYGRKIGILKFVNAFILEGVLIDFLVILYLSFKTLVLKTLSIGSFMALINGCYSLKYNFNALVDNVSVFYQNSIYISRYRDFGKAYNESDENSLYSSKVSVSIDETSADKRAQTTESPFESLSFENIHYCYDSGFALKNINLKILRGQKIAIVGYNGSGKSTLVKLISQLYSPDLGHIRVNGSILTRKNATYFQKKCHVLFQNATLFNLSLSENIALERKVDKKKLESAISKGFLETLIRDLPSQEQTIIGREFDENGCDFSGGERQKIMLARLFYHDKDVIILDEPNSALDVETENQFYDSLLEHQGEKTLIFVSHRLSSVIKCDKIFMLSDGSVIEEGNHDELMALEGKYAEFFKAQASWYTA